MTKKYEYNKENMPIDALISTLLAAILVAIIVKPLANYDMTGWWWGFFIVCNIVYIGYGMKKGWAKGDPANGLVIATGPIAFYTWTIASAWRKYGRKGYYYDHKKKKAGSIRE